ncbi:MAG: hypothetical protein IH888_03105 [Planctomycetes bacterium]|nr:hypothetical protein [Planctomycetota bacterium]
MSEFEHTGTGMQANAGGQSDSLGKLDLEDSGDAGDLDPFMDEGPRKKIRSGTLVLVVVVVLAGGSLFSMHTLTKVNAGAGRNPGIERTINDFLKSAAGGSSTDSGDSGQALVDNHQRVLSALKPVELATPHLTRDPFDTTNENVDEEPEDRGEWNKERRRAAITKAAKTLKVQSVIMGSTPMAIINGHLVRLNGVVEAMPSGRSPAIQFRMVAVAHTSVTVVAEDPQFDLRIETVLEFRRGR